MPRTLIEVRRDADEPLYRQIRRAIEHGIANGLMQDHLPLPSSRELARELGLSRNTVTTAYQELIAEGFIESRPRSGLFVNPEMRAFCVSDGLAVDDVAHVNWAARIPARDDDPLPHSTKVDDWYRYPYPFIVGQVAPDAFPRLAWARALRSALEPPHVHFSLRDAVSAEDPFLLDMLCRRILPSRGIEASPAEVVVTMGSQHGLQLLSQLLLQRGDVVGVEDPGYLDARHIFLRAGAGLAAFPVDEQGVIPPPSLDGIAMMYLTPSHHHPTNVTLAPDRRRELLRLAAAADAIIIEDDYDSEFRYEGNPSPALKSFDQGDRVIYLGTFSKFLAPGLRLGYIVCAPELATELRNLRRYAIRHPPGHSQRALALLIESGDYHRNLRLQRAVLQQKWQTLRQAANRYLPWETDPQPGGVSLWMTGPTSIDCVELVRAALERGVVIERGDIYFLDGSARNHFRIGFGAISLGVIEPGMRVLGEVVAGLLQPLSSTT